jgi:hypothetical protein
VTGASISRQPDGRHLYETAKALCRVMRVPRMWQVLTAAGLTEEDRAGMEEVRAQLRASLMNSYQQEAQAAWLALPALAGKAILLTELANLSLLAQAELPPDRRPLYQIGELLDRPTSTRREAPTAPR